MVVRASFELAASRLSAERSTPELPDAGRPCRPAVWVRKGRGPVREKDGRGRGVRTPDLRFWRPPLYQLSYTPMVTRRGRVVRGAP